MRVLALHGFRTNAAILRSQLAALFKKLPTWQLTCIDAPNQAMGAPEEVVTVAFPLESKFYEWYGFKPKEDGSFEYLNFETSINYLKSVIVAGEYDVLLGFSQVSSIYLHTETLITKS